MADVDSVVYTTTERKVRKVKKTTKRRESHDQNASEVTITELDSTQNNHHAIEEYVLADRYTAVPADPPLLLLLLIVSSFLLLLTATRYQRCRIASAIRTYLEFPKTAGRDGKSRAETPNSAKRDYALIELLHCVCNYDSLRKTNWRTELAS